MPAPVDASTSASSIVDNYDGDLDRLMNAIAAYTNRSVPTGFETGATIFVGSDGTPVVGGTRTVLTRGDDNTYTDTSGNRWVAGADGSGRTTWTRLNVEVNGQPMNAANIEKPGFQLTAATVTNDITTNIGFTAKVVADKSNWNKIIKQAVG